MVKWPFLGVNFEWSTSSVSRKQPLAKIEDQPTRKMAQLWLMYWPDFFRHMGLSF